MPFKPFFVYNTRFIPNCNIKTAIVDNGYRTLFKPRVLFRYNNKTIFLKNVYIVIYKLKKPVPKSYYCIYIYIFIFAGKSNLLTTCIVIGYFLNHFHNQNCMVLFKKSVYDK